MRQLMPHGAAVPQWPCSKSKVCFLNQFKKNGSASQASLLLQRKAVADTWVRRTGPQVGVLPGLWKPCMPAQQAKVVHALTSVLLTPQDSYADANFDVLCRQQFRCPFRV